MAVSIENERDRIETADISSRDRKLLKDFDAHLAATLDTPGAGHHVALLTMCRLVAGDVGLSKLVVPHDEASIPPSERQQQARDHAANISGAIDSRTDTSGSETRYYAAIKRFLRASDETRLEYIPDVDQIFSGSSSNTDPAPDPDEVLWWSEDIPKIMAATNNLRDRMSVPMLWASGMRPDSEMRPLSVGDITLYENHVVVDVPADAKTTDENLTLYCGAPYFRYWKQNHWGRDCDEWGPSTPLLPVSPRYGNPATDRLSYNSWAKRVREAGRRADIDRRGNA